MIGMRSAVIRDMRSAVIREVDDLAAFRRASNEGVLAGVGPLPNDLADVSSSAEEGTGRLIPDSSQVCVVYEDEWCVAAGALVSAARGRRLERGRPRTSWTDFLAEIGADRSWRSALIIVPAWAADGSSNPSALEESMAAIRAWAGPARPVGLLTGPSPPALTWAAVRVACSEQLLARYRARPVAIVADGGASYARAPDRRIFDSTESLSVARQLLRARWSAVLVSGHGRSYCAARGLLCAAHSPSAVTAELPSAAGEKIAAAVRSPGVGRCVAGLDCVDPSWARLDPRRIDTAILVADSCSALSPSGFHWAAGAPAVGVLAAGGPALAVIGSDAIVERCDDVASTLLVLASCTTVGEAVVTLNDRHRTSNRPLPYWLVGDPDLALDLAWCVPTETVSGASTPGVAFTARSQRRSSSGAETLLARSAGWQTPLDRAGRTLMPVARALTRAQLDGHPPDERLWRRWVRAHGLAIDELRTDVTPSAWPVELFFAAEVRGGLAGRPCPVCGARETTLRRYRVAREHQRVSLDCTQCDFVEDHPDDVDTQLLWLAAPDELRPGDNAPLLLRFAGPEPAVATVLVTGRHGHRVDVDPKFRYLSSVTEFTIRVREVAIGHRYHLRVLALVDGDWWWRSRPILLRSS